MVELTATVYHEGDRIDAMSVADFPFVRYQGLGIFADVWDGPNGAAYVPMVESEKPGSGKFDEFLDALMTAVAPREVIFVNLINLRLEIHLMNRGIRCMEPEEAWPNKEIGA